MKRKLISFSILKTEQWIDEIDLMLIITSNKQQTTQLL